MLDTNQVIYGAIQRVARERSLDWENIHDRCALVDDLGFKSLDLARIIAILELQLDVDPFAEQVSITAIRTVGDLCAAYAACLPDQTGDGSDKPPPQTEPAAESANTSRDPQRQRALRKRVRDGNS
jgi:acyl carrier protein